MKYENLRDLVRSEREAAKLIALPSDTFEKGHAELISVTQKVYELKDPFSDDARSLIDVTNAIRATLQELYIIRLNKILMLAISQVENNYYDRDEVKRMIAPEREMFEQCTAAIERCQENLLKNAKPPLIPPAVAVIGGNETGADDILIQDLIGSGPISDEEPGAEEEQRVQKPAPVSSTSHSPPYTLVRVLEDSDTFMGVDGRIYTLSKGDIVTLPERNATVLSERNIVLNMNLGK
jgi:DNA replication factor GINS